MPIIINNIKAPLGSMPDEIIQKAVAAAKLRRSDIVSADIHKTSIDARDNQNIVTVSSVYVCLTSEKAERSMAERNKNISFAVNARLEPEIGTVHKNGRVVVAGYGPAGMFAGLILARCGYRPLIIERGAEMDKRISKVKEYSLGGALDTNTNIQFGEGGAGTFSDGKLTCRTKDELCALVSKELVAFGAPEEILHKAKPHIGTDKLREVVKNIRLETIRLGGEVRFETALTDITQTPDGLKASLSDGSEVLCSSLILAIGHSARDTFEMLASKNVFLEPKPFSVGVRIEHRQQDVDRSLYGSYAGDPVLPKGEYQLSYRNSEGRGVYTFCMCPGGYVVPSASEENSTVTNGMSEFARDGENANAAVAVSVTPDDFGRGALDGMRFQREIERRAFALTKNKAPACSVKGLFEGKAMLSDKINPTYSRGVEAADMSELFPGFVTDMLKTGLQSFGRKMACFADGDALLTAPETRTSSPVRITRGENRQSLTLPDLYPCGEGAGYAGGIMSAAVDGIKTALAVMKDQAPSNNA
ncbi:FAD-dependent protein [Ruminococcus sp. NK3A76]|uniref:NAD(P)/FAD-dependent oxidoreductase n=1 Tax=Ruminococcus sp. NK3A76 TaxID=877411 RepID=UPI000490D066|nr:NAD(P)/FAD-dependent oxidoreductase [Ruminococcus sp. NK3A76]